MKRAKLLHNTSAGEEDHEADVLLNQIKEQGFECSYSSTKKDALKKLESGFDFLVAAGGDGTIRKITRSLLKRKKLEKPWTIALLPLGTANNISKSLGIDGETEALIKEWHHSALKAYDVGDVYHNNNELGFFLESFGFGIFPELMKQGQKENIDEEPKAENRIQSALNILHKIVSSYEPRNCKIIADGKDLSGKYLMVEVMNAKSFGPNLIIASDADVGDGQFELVLIPAEKRKDLANYVQTRMEGKEVAFEFPTIRAKKLLLTWKGKDAHMDDELVGMKKSKKVFIEPRRGLLQFMVPNQ